MNWKTIINDCPLAFNRLCAHSIGVENWKELGWRVELRRGMAFLGPEVYDETGTRQGSLSDYVQRLYGFFDESGIYLKVSPTHQTPCEFLAAIITERASRGVGGAELTRFSKRKDAEDAAFMLAFETMEKQMQPVPA